MDDTGSFFDTFAAVQDARFDQQNGNSPPEDVGFYRDLATEADGPALGVGVGTGRVYLELLDAGLDVDGFDLSEGSLNRLRSKATDRGLSPTVWVDDATDFDVDREYGFIYAPARAFNFTHTLEKQKQALRSIRDALAPEGRFALNTFVPRFDAVEEYGEPQTDEVTIDGEQYRVVQTTYLDDEVEQVTRYQRELYHDGELVAKRETPFALIPKRQFELLFEVTGYSDWTVTGDFEGASLDSAEQEMVWIVDA
ncbi:methyltransferase domain-containing protein [Halostella pelagica]|uniref:methyltransferase domain-containing protein n=1 Tax=Halostella pelagica TaxID=2583824 RepID=UPI001080A50C|nr:class I SAM-dependent methyltransferase [Halostella pelagica]